MLGDRAAEALPASLAPVLGARKDGTAGAPSSRGLLTTLLGEFVLPAGGAAWTRTLLEALGALGVKEKAARQALARLEDRGWLQRERRGRTTRWSLTETSTELLRSGADRIYGFAAARRDWDRRWVVLLASVPEADRRQRYRMAQGLEWAGFGSIGSGTWISPWVDREPHAAELLGELGVHATSFVAEVGALGSGPELAAVAWDLPALRSDYDRFLDETDRVDPSVLDPRESMVQLTALVHRWRRFPFLDPDIPVELLDADWPAPSAARRFGALRAALAPSASSWWTDAETGAKSTGALHGPG